MRTLITSEKVRMWQIVWGEGWYINRWLHDCRILLSWFDACFYDDHECDSISDITQWADSYDSSPLNAHSEWVISLISHIACTQHYGVLISCRALIINLGIVDRYDVCDSYHVHLIRIMMIMMIIMMMMMWDINYMNVIVTMNGNIITLPDSKEDANRIDYWVLNV